jgi:transposase
MQSRAGQHLRPTRSLPSARWPRSVVSRYSTVIADAGHESRKLARQILRDDGWNLQIVKRRQRAFKITGLTWIVERSFAWLGRNRRLSKDYEYAVQTSETMIDIAAIRIMLNRLAPA